MSIVLFSMAMIIGFMASYAIARIKSMRSQKKIEAPEPVKIVEAEDESWSDVLSTPAGFFNLVRDALPKDKGLIYELEARQFTLEGRERRAHNDPRIGDHSVTIKMIEPVSGDVLKELVFYETQSYINSYGYDTASFKESVAEKVNDILLKRQKSKMVGHKEIVC